MVRQVDHKVGGVRRLVVNQAVLVTGCCLNRTHDVVLRRSGNAKSGAIIPEITMVRGTFLLTLLCTFFYYGFLHNAS